MLQKEEIRFGSQVSVKKSLNWDNIYNCGCYFNEAIQIKQKKLNWNKIHRLCSIIWLREKLTSVFIKKNITCCQKKLFSARKF